MRSEDESRLQGYLQGWLVSLEERLEFPKNTWRRRQEIQNQIADVQKRLAAVQKTNRRDGRWPVGDHRIVLIQSTTLDRFGKLGDRNSHRGLG